MKDRKDTLIIRGNKPESEIFTSSGLDDYDALFKFKLIGDSGAGKSRLLLRYADDTYFDGFISTIGVDFKNRTIKIDGKRIKTQVWDTAGQERFRTIESQNMRGAHAFICVFDLTDKVSFNNIETRLEEMKKEIGEKTSIILVGTKLDEVKKRCVTQDEVESFINNSAFKFDGYIETSSKKNINVKTVFETAAKVLLDRKSLEEIEQKNKIIVSNDPRKRLCNDNLKNLTLEELNKKFMPTYNFFSINKDHPRCSRSEWIKLWGEKRAQALKVLEADIQKNPANTIKIIEEAMEKYPELLINHRKTSGVVGLFNSYRTSHTERRLSKLKSRALSQALSISQKQNKG